MAWLPPMLPSFAPQTIARWAATPTWTPPGTRALVRHIAPDGTRIVTSERTPVRGFSIEFDLGVVQVHGQQGASRLLRAPDGFILTTIEGDLAEGYADLGYVEQAALPMLVPLELRRVPTTGQLTLVCGQADPLYGCTEWVRTLGFVDGFPVEPRRAQDLRVTRSTTTLWRTLEPAGRHHGYRTGDEPAHTVALLGAVWVTPARGMVPLSVDREGIVSTPLCSPGRKRLGVKELGRWAAAPLAWSDRRFPKGWAVRAAASRVRSLGSVLVGGRPRRPEATLGYLRTEPLDDWLALYSSTHPVTRDQFLTRSPLEATDMGYVIDGVLGYVSPHGIDLGRTGLGTEVKWASRFGQRRRYVEPA